MFVVSRSLSANLHQDRGNYWPRLPRSPCSVIVPVTPPSSGISSFWWEVLQLGIRKAFDKFKCGDYRTMAFIIGAKRQQIQNLRHHPTVVSYVRISDDCTQRSAIGRPRGFPFLDQISQGLLADHGIYHLTHNALWIFESSVS